MRAPASWMRVPGLVTQSAHAMNTNWNGRRAQSAGLNGGSTTPPGIDAPRKTMSMFTT